MTTSSAAPGRWRLYLLWLALIVIAIALGIGLWLSGRAKAETLQGTVEAEQVNVSTKVMARVEKLNASLGQAVKAGEVLAVLSSPELTGVREQAAGGLAQHQHLAVAGSVQQRFDLVRAVVKPVASGLPAPAVFGVHRRRQRHLAGAAQARQGVDGGLAAGAGQ